MRVPSIKTLEAWTRCPVTARRLRYILKASRSTLVTLPGAADLDAASYGRQPTSRLRMEALDAVAGTYGVEGFRLHNGDWVEYLNAGDTYTPTILKWRGNYHLRDWGTLVERHGAD